MRRLRLPLLPAFLAAAGCASGAVPGAPDGAPDEDLLVPAGFGTLRQDDITMTLRAEGVQLKVTPLEEWVLRLAAPDTHRRLSGLADSHRAAARERTGVEPVLVLASFFSDEQGSVFHPEDVTLDNRGRRLRPLAILPLTGGWGNQRLTQRQTEMAVYAFGPELDLDLEVVLEYRGQRSADWTSVLLRLATERTRARARAGGGR
ncbi:MAG TPA: hypothetical protein VGA70_05305 [Longimicrobiales bacterium]